MSWSLSVPQSSPEDLENAARKAHADHQNANGAWEPEATEHFMAALKAAKVMADAMAPDGWEHQLVVSMVGHANPGHSPQDGMSNDTMTVTVTQVPTNQKPQDQPDQNAEPVAAEPMAVSGETADDTPAAQAAAQAAEPHNLAWDAQGGNQPSTPAEPPAEPPATRPTPGVVPPLPSPGNPVPIEQAKEAAPYWEQQVTPESSSGGQVKEGVPE